MKRQMLSFDAGVDDATLVGRLSRECERLGREKSEVLRSALAAAVLYLEGGGGLGHVCISPAEATQLDRLRAIATQAGISTESTLERVADALAPVVAESGKLPFPLIVRTGPQDAREERIAGVVAVIRRNLRELESLL